MAIGYLRLTCKQAHRLIAERMDRDLKLIEDVRVRLHLRRCPCCSEFVEQMNLLRNAMRRIDKSAP